MLSIEANDMYNALLSNMAAVESILKHFVG